MGTIIYLFKGEHYVELHLHKNGASLGDATGHYSFYTGPSGVVRDQGGRTAVGVMCSLHSLYSLYSLSLDHPPGQRGDSQPLL